ncbi:MAG: ribosome biogenesis GTP-binding protein YihA/YsxC [Alphaproteobacteria bacterium]
MTGTQDYLFNACVFIRSVAGPEQLPPSDRGEIALAGRSNVGKSSLINTLTGRKTLAKTSHTPGRTQQLNFFDMGETMYMVDMPGYGFAKVGKAIKRDWNKLIRDYLRGRPNLRCVFVLIDSRHGVKENDEAFFTFLDEMAVPYRIVLTKTDKVKSEELEKVVEDTKNALKKHTAAFPDILTTSARKASGIDELRSIIAGYAA